MLFGDSVYLGDTTPSGIYVGDTLIWPKTPFSGFSITSSIEFPKSGGTMQIRIKSHTTWEIGTDANWLSFSQTTGSGNTYVTVTATDNDTESARTATITGQTLDTVYSGECAVEQMYRIPYETMYFTIRSLADNNLIQLPRSAGYSASTDNGQTWTAVNNSFSSVTINSGDTILFKHIDNNSYQGGRKFTASSYYEVYGNLASLMVGDSFSSVTSASTLNTSYPFNSMFSGDTMVVNAENLIIPWGTLISYNGSSTGVCANMFIGCTALVSAPELPATTVGDSCYKNMFKQCANLVKAPSVLPALSVPGGCYQDMFQSCTSLVKAPLIMATAATGSYALGGMLAACSSLTDVPDLSITGVSSTCCQSMFAGCTSLTKAPLLPAPSLSNYCYYNMFQGCSSLNEIVCLATSRANTQATFNWVYGVSGTGTFYKNPNATFWSYGTSAIPNGWTVQDYSE